MLTYKRYQALRAIHIRVPGEPGNEATSSSLEDLSVQYTYVHLHFNCNVTSVQPMRPGIGQNVFYTQWVTLSRSSFLGVMWFFDSLS